MRVAYHGTTIKNAGYIEQEGIVPLPLLPPVIMTGYVYMTEDRAMAERFGEAVFEVDLDKLDQDKLDSYRERLCDIFDTSDFINHHGIVPPEALRRVK